MAKILVTGGAGYIGSHVAKQILELTDHDVVILDNLSTGSEETIKTLKSISKHSKGSLHFLCGDLSSFDLINELFKFYRFDAVMHFAASIVVSESVKEPLKYYLNNTVNTVNLIKLCNDYAVKFIFSSTAAVYGEPEEEKIKEGASKSPINPYGMSKLLSEQVLIDTAKANKDFRYVIFRYFNVVGADMKDVKNPRIGESHNPETHLIPLVCKAALGKKEAISIFGDDYDTKDGTCIRDYIHVEDLASAHLMGLEYLLNDNESNVFNCGYGHGFSVKEVIETIKKVSGKDFTIKIEPKRDGDPSVLIADNEKIKSVLKWKPKYNDLCLISMSALNWEKVP